LSRKKREDKREFDAMRFVDKSSTYLKRDIKILKKILGGFERG